MLTVQLSVWLAERCMLFQDVKPCQGKNESFDKKDLTFFHDLRPSDRPTALSFIKVNEF